MATAFRQISLTVEVFQDLYEALPEKWELVDGVPLMMADGTPLHASIAANIIFALRLKLRGSSCRPIGSDLMLRIDERNGRLPDVGVYCDPRDLERLRDRDYRSFRFPTVLFEVLSESTAKEDRGVKLWQYQDIATLRAVVLVDPDRETYLLFERQGAAEWRERKSSPGDDLSLACLDLILTADEIFG